MRIRQYAAFSSSAVHAFSTVLQHHHYRLWFFPVDSPSSQEHNRPSLVRYRLGRFGLPGTHVRERRPDKGACSCHSCRDPRFSASILRAKPRAIGCAPSRSVRKIVPPAAKVCATSIPRCPVTTCAPAPLPRAHLCVPADSIRLTPLARASSPVV